MEYIAYVSGEAKDDNWVHPATFVAQNDEEALKKAKEIVEGHNQHDIEQSRKRGERRGVYYSLLNVVRILYYEIIRKPVVKGIMPE